MKEEKEIRERIEVVQRYLSFLKNTGATQIAILTQERELEALKWVLNE